MRDFGHLKSLRTLINRSGTRLESLKLEASIQAQRTFRIQKLLSHILNDPVAIGDLSHGLLTLYVPHAALATKLRFEEASLIDALKGDPLFRGIRRIQCRVKPRDKAEKISRKTTKTPSSKAGAAIQEFSDTLQDKELRRQFQQLAARVSGNQPPDQTS